MCTASNNGHESRTESAPRRSVLFYLIGQARVSPDKSVSHLVIEPSIIACASDRRFSCKSSPDSGHMDAPRKVLSLVCCVQGGIPFRINTRKTDLKKDSTTKLTKALRHQWLHDSIGRSHWLRDIRLDKTTPRITITIHLFSNWQF